MMYEFGYFTLDKNIIDPILNWTEETFWLFFLN